MGVSVKTSSVQPTDDAGLGFRLQTETVPFEWDSLTVSVCLSEYVVVV